MLGLCLVFGFLAGAHAGLSPAFDKCMTDLCNGLKADPVVQPTDPNIKAFMAGLGYDFTNCAYPTPSEGVLECKSKLVAPDNHVLFCRNPKTTPKSQCFPGNVNLEDTTASCDDLFKNLQTFVNNIVQNNPVCKAPGRRRRADAWPERFRRSARLPGVDLSF